MNNWLNIEINSYCHCHIDVIAGVLPLTVVLDPEEGVALSLGSLTMMSIPVRLHLQKNSLKLKGCLLVQSSYNESEGF